MNFQHDYIDGSEKGKKDKKKKKKKDSDDEGGDKITETAEVQVKSKDEKTDESTLRQRKVVPEVVTQVEQTNPDDDKNKK